MLKGKIITTNLVKIELVFVKVHEPEHPPFFKVECELPLDNGRTVGFKMRTRHQTGKTDELTLGYFSCKG
jgi:hypothetical protein